MKSNNCKIQFLYISPLNLGKPGEIVVTTVFEVSSRCNSHKGFFEKQ